MAKTKRRKERSTKEPREAKAKREEDAQIYERKCQVFRSPLATISGDLHQTCKGLRGHARTFKRNLRYGSQSCDFEPNCYGVVYDNRTNGEAVSRVLTSQQSMEKAIAFTTDQFLGFVLLDSSELFGKF